MPNNGPIPSYPSTRLLGCELELDLGRTQDRATFPRVPQGWAQHCDGSLTNGTEIVLEPPVTLVDALPRVKEFSEVYSHVNTLKTGGFHVHVQCADWGGAGLKRNSGNLARLYHHFQEQINCLLGKSRHNNRYCPPYEHRVTDAEIVAMFRLDSAATTRESAKSARCYSVVNFAMARCTTPAHRSIEFRQGSITKRFECIVGWMTFCLAMVDIAGKPDFQSWLALPATWDRFCAMLRDQERAVGAEHLVEWVKWRKDYLNEPATPELVEKACECMGTAPRGVFHVSRKLDINLALTERVLEAAVSAGKLTKSGTKYQASFRARAEADLARLEAAARERELAPAAGVVTG